MAILGMGKRKRDEEKGVSKNDITIPGENKKKSKAKPVSKETAPAQTTNFSGVLLRPRITEKATLSMERLVYVFEVSPRANKTDVTSAVSKIYKVIPEKVRMVRIPAKNRVSQMRRTRGIKSGGKKAYVYLKKGDSIEIV